ncbi:MAG: DUF3341 domain-containing protein [Chloroflexi bacterium]|nr:DUF3341 domain-containing protein [Chloroflexota bacterium]
MARRSILGLFSDPDTTANAMDALRGAGYKDWELDILSGAPYPEGTFGEHMPSHHLFKFPLIGAACGLAVAILLTAGTQLAYPVVTGGKPILAIPAMAIICYEGTMLGAILFTVFGIIFESRLPRPRVGIYDKRITEGYIGIVVTSDETRVVQAEKTLKMAGAIEIKSGA